MIVFLSKVPIQLIAVQIVFESFCLSIHFHLLSRTTLGSTTIGWEAFNDTSYKTSSISINISVTLNVSLLVSTTDQGSGNREDIFSGSILGNEIGFLNAELPFIGGENKALALSTNKEEALMQNYCL